MNEPLTEKERETLLNLLDEAITDRRKNRMRRREVAQYSTIKRKLGLANAATPQSGLDA